MPNDKIIQNGQTNINGEKVKETPEEYLDRLKPKHDEPLPGWYGTNDKQMTELQELGTYDSNKYIYNLPEPPQLIPCETPATFNTLDASKEILRQLTYRKLKIKDGIFAEYGLDKGKSYLPFCEKFPDKTILGFDGFKGLPNGEWPGNIVHDTEFDHKGEIKFTPPNNANIIPGWFEKTIPTYDYKNDKVSCVHIDCDTYSSTVTILNSLKGKFVSGSIVIFDDYFNTAAWRYGEHKAWIAFVEAEKLNYKHLYVAGMATSIIIK